MNTTKIKRPDLASVDIKFETKSISHSMYIEESQIKQFSSRTEAEQFLTRGIKEVIYRSITFIHGSFARITNWDVFEITGNNRLEISITATYEHRIVNQFPYTTSVIYVFHEEPI